MKRYLIKETPVSSTKIDYRKHLNDEQYEVVTTADGPSLVLAGAGSGKTRTLIYRVAYLLERGVPAKNILLVTFTNKAAHHMQDRMEILLKGRPAGLWCGTFHHIGNRSIRMYARHLGISENFGILDEEDSRDLIASCIKSLKIKTTEFRFPKAAIVQSIISFAINSKQDVEDVIEKYYPYFMQFVQEIKDIQNLYEKRKLKSNNLDYDDLLTKWIWLLKKVKAANEIFTKQFRYILVDEYQDTNRLQYDIIVLLSSFHKNILVVGDDAQSIYSFRAAQIRNILDFPEQFSGAKIFRLQTNYRSTPQILHLANQSIKHNKQQFPKTLKSIQEDGQPPCLIQVKDLSEQAAFVAQRILELRDEGLSLDGVAVLFRAHYQSAELELELLKRNIPYVIRGGVRFFEQAHIKDVLAYLKILLNPIDEISWLRVLKLYPGIGSGFADKIFLKLTSIHKPIDEICNKEFYEFLPPRPKEGLKRLIKVLKSIKDEQLLQHPDELVRRIIENGYEEYCILNFENSEDRVDDLKELVNFAHRYKSTREFLTDITLRESFKGETMQAASSNDEYLVLSTIHQAKGLEWEAVILISLSDGQFPHPKSIDSPEQLEEERRLFYVAATRAKKQLYLMHPILRYDYNFGTVISRPSIFLTELPPSCYEKWEINEEVAPSFLMPRSSE